MAYLIPVPILNPKKSISQFFKFLTACKFSSFFVYVKQTKTSLLLYIDISAGCSQLFSAQFGSAHDSNPACKHNNFTSPGAAASMALPPMTLLCPGHKVSSPWLSSSSTTIHSWKNHILDHYYLSQDSVFALSSQHFSSWDELHIGISPWTVQ